MARFGDFTLLDDLGRSRTADRFRAAHDATHDVRGGVFFLKIHRRLERSYWPLLQAKEFLLRQREPLLLTDR